LCDHQEKEDWTGKLEEPADAFKLSELDTERAEVEGESRWSNKEEEPDNADGKCCLSEDMVARRLNEELTAFIALNEGKQMTHDESKG
jgi:hypothetical protein